MNLEELNNTSKKQAIYQINASNNNQQLILADQHTSYFLTEIFPNPRRLNN